MIPTLFVHIPGTHFVAGWTGGPFLPLSLQRLSLNWRPLGYQSVLYQLSYGGTTIQTIGASMSQNGARIQKTRPVCHKMEMRK